MENYENHYRLLFHQLSKEHGEINNVTIVGVVGFQYGGPVSMQMVGNDVGFVTVELSLYEEQKISVEGVRFELFTRSVFPEGTAQRLLTAIGNLSMNATLGAGHTVDVSFLQTPDVEQVKLSLFSQVTLSESNYGIYEVVRVS